jgi:hypothetical protein
MRREEYVFIAAVLRDAYSDTRDKQRRKEIQKAHELLESIVGQLLSYHEYPWPTPAAWLQQ